MRQCDKRRPDRHERGITGPSGAQDTGHNDADVAFTQAMIPHHQQAVEMAMLAETRANDAEVKQIAAKIKDAQAAEIVTMTRWLIAWRAPTPGGPTMPGTSAGMPSMMPDTEMAQLRQASGKDFDRMFVRMMIAHHNGAIQSAQDEQSRGANADAKALAAAIVRTQTDEVVTLQAILDRL